MLVSPGSTGAACVNVVARCGFLHDEAYHKGQCTGFAKNIRAYRCNSRRYLNSASSESAAKCHLSLQGTWYLDKLSEDEGLVLQAFLSYSDHPTISKTAPFALLSLQAQKEAKTWQSMHYYKLQHVFFSKYHTTQPVYASWGPEKNPEILNEPGVSGGLNVVAKEFAARGAPKRARRRMAAIEDRSNEAEADALASELIQEVRTCKCSKFCSQRAIVHVL